eukprot:5552050-Pleurochrysis_carterae.AAC.1
MYVWGGGRPRGACARQWDLKRKTQNRKDAHGEVCVGLEMKGILRCEDEGIAVMDTTASPESSLQLWPARHE